MSTKINPNAIAEGSISIDKIENLSTRLENIESSAGGGSSNANVQAVDTGDVLDDVNVEYATTAYVDNKVANISLTGYATITYVDELVGDINSVLESIISGGGGVSLITFTIAGTEYQAESGMSFGQWMLSDYYVLGTFMNDTNHIAALKLDPSSDDILYANSGFIYNPSITTQSIIIEGQNYIVITGGGFE